MTKDVVITGVGLVTPLGDTPEQMLTAIAAGHTAASQPKAFPAQGFACPLCATIPAAIEPLVPDSKMIRFMNRDAMLAVIAARRAVQDANLKIGRNYQSEEVGIFGATGLAGVALEEVSRLASNATDETGRFDLGRFGTVALRQVRPVLSFKILSNMPVCFVAISEQLRGINTVYTPWEGQGAHAIASGVRAIQHGDAACALVGGCDTKAHLLEFIALEQQGIFRSWRQTRSGTIPGEGACFLVLEEYLQARQRGARIYARILDHVMGTVTEASGRPSALTAMLKRLNLEPCNGIMAAGDGDMSLVDHRTWFDGCCSP